MTLNEFQPLAARLAAAGLATWPPLPRVAPAGTRSKLEEWAWALSEIDASLVTAAVDWLIAHSTEPVARPGVIRARCDAIRSEIRASNPFPSSASAGGRRYTCSRCNDTGMVAGLVRVGGERRWQGFACGCELSRSRPVAKIPEGMEIIRIYDSIHGTFLDPDDPMGYRMGAGPRSGVNGARGAAGTTTESL